MEELTLELLIKEIPSFPNYFVDIYGDVYRKTKTVGLRKLTAHLDKNSYRRIDIRKDMIHYNKSIAGLVLETFVSLRPNKCEVCHGVNGKQDDSLSNLSWGTKSKNNGEDKLRDSTDSRGSKNGSSKLTEEQVLEIRKLKNIKSRTQLAILFNVSYTTIKFIQLRKRWFWL